MPLARECTRGLLQPRVASVTAIGADRQAAESSRVGKENDSAARAAAAGTVIIRVESGLSVRGNRSRARDRARVDNHDATTGSAAAINAGAGGRGACAA